MDEAEKHGAGQVGKNFERASLRAQYLSTKKQVWGRKPDASWGPEPADGAPSLSGAGEPCVYCGFSGHGQGLDTKNDHHADVSPENLAPADILCHAWHHLGELGKSNGVIAYLPGLEPRDVVHLQRTILIALQIGDADEKTAARKLLNWMASHNRYVKEVWGSHEPSNFAAAMVADDVDPLERQAQAFDGLALVLNPSAAARHVATWASENYANLPTRAWPGLANEFTQAAG